MARTRSHRPRRTGDSSAGPRLVDHLQGPLPVVAQFEPLLYPGWNDVGFEFKFRAAANATTWSRRRSAAVAPGPLPSLGSASPARRWQVTDCQFPALALAKPPWSGGGSEIPEASKMTLPVRIWLAVALADRGSVAYRVFGLHKSARSTSTSCTRFRIILTTVRNGSPAFGTSDGRFVRTSRISRITSTECPRELWRTRNRCRRFRSAFDGRPVGNGPVTLNAAPTSLRAPTKK